MRVINALFGALHIVSMGKKFFGLCRIGGREAHIRPDIGAQNEHIADIAIDHDQSEIVIEIVIDPVGVMREQKMIDQHNAVGVGMEHVKILLYEYLGVGIIFFG